MDGVIDYAGNDVRLRGTFVPLFGLNNMFGQIPIVGLFLGGDQRGPHRHHVRGGRPARRADPARQPDVGARARPDAQDLFEFPSSVPGATASRASAIPTRSRATRTGIAEVSCRGATGGGGRVPPPPAPVPAMSRRTRGRAPEPTTRRGRLRRAARSRAIIDPNQGIGFRLVSSSGGKSPADVHREERTSGRSRSATGIREQGVQAWRPLRSTSPHATRT